MIEDLPLLEFIYLEPRSIGIIGDIINLGTTSDTIKVLDSLEDHYVITSHDSNLRYYQCPVYDMIFSDVSDSNGYYLLLSNHSLSNLDMFIHRDDGRIHDKILATVNFFLEVSARDHSESVVVVRYRDSATSSIPGVIANVLMEHFTILDEIVSEYCLVKIKRKDD